MGGGGGGGGGGEGEGWSGGIAIFRILHKVFLQKNQCRSAEYFCPT